MDVCPRCQCEAYRPDRGCTECGYVDVTVGSIIIRHCGGGEIRLNRGEWLNCNAGELEARGLGRRVDYPFNLGRIGCSSSGHPFVEFSRTARLSGRVVCGGVVVADDGSAYPLPIRRSVVVIEFAGTRFEIEAG